MQFSLLVCFVHGHSFWTTGFGFLKQLIILAVFGAVDEPIASCMQVHFLEI